MTFNEELLASHQGRLFELGWYHLRIDGKDGPGTQNALMRFKAASGLMARPYPGPATFQALWSPGAKRAPAAVPSGGDPAWLTEARSLLGTRETPGPGSNPVIMQMARNLDQWYPGDDLPWCGLFVAHCMAAGAPHEPQDFNRLGARAWLGYGEPCGEMLGAVAVFWRTHKTRSVNGHVGLLTGVNAEAVRVIGGNQSDMVSELWLPRQRLLGLRGPERWSGAMAPAPVVPTGALSMTEA